MAKNPIIFLPSIFLPSLRPMKFKLCIDPGHGMGNRLPGVPDPGCVRGEIREADIVLKWAHALRRACLARGVDVWMTRALPTVDAPLSKRVAAAQKQSCTHLISLHVNDADSPKAHGTETLVRSDGNVPIARLVQSLAVQHLGLKDRRIVRRDDLAILKHPNSCLLELGFIGSSSDLAAMQCPACRADLCDALAGLYASLVR
jgi:N-acetylmuramoyl-L-alanine amidase